MDYQSVFIRHEIKFLLCQDDRSALLSLLERHAEPDNYPSSLICNLYYDTPSALLIRRSLEKPLYKEKLRLRSYGIPTKGSTVFAEIKKKYNSVVYKRRISMNEENARLCFSGVLPFPDTQIGREIAFFFERYERLDARVFLSYERESFRDKDGGDLRITLDKNILWRDYELSLSAGAYGSPILKPHDSLLEIKSSRGVPTWLLDFLGERKIYKQSFSKYGKAYEQILISRSNVINGESV